MNASDNELLLGAVLTLKQAFRKNKAKVYSVAAESLQKSKSKRPLANVGKIGRVTKAGDVVLVPGKVLGAGDLTHDVVVGAFSFSRGSIEKISKAGGKVLSLGEMVERYPSGKGVILVGG